MSRTKKKDLLILDVFNIIYPLIIGSLTFEMTSQILTLDSSSGLSFVLFFFLFFILFVLTSDLIYYLLPKLEEGLHTFPKSRISMIWILKFYLKKPITVPLISNCIYTIHYLSYVHLKLLRCQVSPNFQFAANVELRDPELLSFGKNITIGSDCILAPHIMLKNKLLLTKISIDDNSSIGAFSAIGPGVKIGKNCKIGSYVKIRPGAIIEDNVTVGDFCIIEDSAKIGKGSIIKKDIRIKAKTIIEPRSVIKD